MEACMIKPEVKKKPVKPKPPPKPAQIKGNDPERLKKPAPVVPTRPTDAELSLTHQLKTATTTNTEETLSAGSELSAGSDSLSENNKEAGGPFSGKIFKESLKPTEAAQTDEDPTSLNSDVSGCNDLSENSKEKGGFFSGLLRKSNKILGAGTPGQDKELLQPQLSVSSDNVSENNNNNNIQATESLHSEFSASPSENKLHDGEISTSSEALSESQTKEKGGIFSGIFKKSPKLAETAEPEEDESPDTELLIRNDLTENKQEKGGGLFSKILKKTLKSSGQPTESLEREAEKEPSVSNDEVSENNTTKEKNIFTNVFKSLQKPAHSAAADKKEQDVNSENHFSSSCENQTDTTVVKVKKRGLAGIFQRSTSTDDMFDEESNTSKDKKLWVSWENLLEAARSKEKTAQLAGIFKKSPQPAPRSLATEDLLSNTKELSTSWDSLGHTAEKDLSAYSELSVSNNLSDASSPTKEKKVRFAGIFRRTPKTVEQKYEDMEAPEGGELRRRRTIKKKRRVVSFRVKKTLPQIPMITSSSQTSDRMPIIDDNVELHEPNSAKENTVEVQLVEMAAYPSENNPPETEPESEQESDELMDWWNTVKGWTEWNEASNFQEEDEEMIVEQAADRVYLAARLFVHLFNQRGASLQHRILELLSLADAADQFHKKTVRAAVGGGVASVAGSLATITGLILTPFTFGASVIVTAVGISVATAGSITSATANITDTVHSSMDRKKVEKMIQGYQEEIKDIRECLEFVQEGMDTLQEWDFERYSQSATKKALNHSVKHVVKEGGRAGKDLMINTSTLISTVQLLGATGGAVKAAQVISITTGVMSALFLALDVFFLAKDSHELRKGAKTQFAAKIREVCKDLQDGLLELNKVKTQLQKTMDGIEVEEYEEIEEVEVEIEDDLEWDPKKLAELEQELDLLEEKLDKKVEEEQKKSKETEKENLKSKEKKEKSMKEKGDPEIKEEETREKYTKKEGKESKKEKDEVEGKFKSKTEKLPDVDKEKKTEKSVKAAKEVLKEQSQEGSKKDKETKNQNKKCGSKQDKAKKDTGTNKKTAEEKNIDVKEAESRPGDSVQEDRSRKVNSERVNTERENQRREEIRLIKPEWKPVNKEVESGIMKTHSSRSDSERGRKHEMRETVWRSSTEESDLKSPYRRAITGPDDWRERGDEKRGNRVESARRQFEREEGEEMERGKRREDGESRRRDREREQSRRGYRARSNALLGDGLYI